LRSVVLRSADHGVLYSYAKLSAYALAVLLFGTTGTQDAVANGDTRTIDLVHTHTKESSSITFKRNGTYDAKALQQLNWFLRDWRTDQPTKMDPRLFDIVWEVYRSVGASEGIYVVSPTARLRPTQGFGAARRRYRNTASTWLARRWISFCPALT